MIAELIDLAKRLGIPTPNPFGRLPVHYFIDLDGAGKLLGFAPAYGSTKDKSVEPELGKPMNCPVYFALKLKSDKDPDIQAAGGGGKSEAEAGHGDTKEIFCTLIRLPKGRPPIIEEIQPPAGMQSAITDDDIGENDQTDDEDTPSGKNQYYRHSGWLHRIDGYLTDDTNKQSEFAQAIKAFNDTKYRLTSPDLLALFNLPDPESAAAVKSDAEEKKKAKAEASKARNAQLKRISSARFTFRINGRVLVNDAGFKDWWKRTYTNERTSILPYLPQGDDGHNADSDEASNRLTPVFPNIPNLIPNSGMYCPLASFDKAATRSFGLGKHTLSLSLTSSEQAAAALIWLLQDSNSHCNLGEKLVAVFWAVPPHGTPLPLDFASVLNEPDALQVRDFFDNIHGHAVNAPASAQFYCAILSSPKSRITVRCWHADNLGKVTQKAHEYFHAVSVPHGFRGGEHTASTMRELADAMAPPKGKSGPPPPTYAQILETALFGQLLPHSFLEAAVSRQSIELAKGKSQDDKGEFVSRLRARTALIKLYFQINKNIPMNETTHQTADNPDAYRCGQVLAVLDNIHNVAHGKSTASSPAGRYYGSASSTPALVFPRLCKLARIHLEKIDNRSTAEHLDRHLSSLIAGFSARASWPRTLSLEQQGKFAIGFYYERAQS